MVLIVALVTGCATTPAVTPLTDCSYKIMGQGGTRVAPHAGSGQFGNHTCIGPSSELGVT
jgi:hypothetical protein